MATNITVLIVFSVIFLGLVGLEVLWHFLKAWSTPKYSNLRWKVHRDFVIATFTKKLFRKTTEEIRYTEILWSKDDYHNVSRLWKNPDTGEVSTAREREWLSARWDAQYFYEAMK